MPYTRLRTRAAQILLWVSVINMSIWLGGTLFMMLVFNPLWTASPPQSAHFYWVEARFSSTIFNFFGPVWMPIRTLPLLGALIVCWNVPTHRKNLLFTVAINVSMIIFTLAYVYPINTIIFTPAINSITAEEAGTLTNRWIVADRIRFVTMCFGYLTLLRAFSIPLPVKG
jgi:hypothetical protein